MLKHLCPSMNPPSDPFQFAYKSSKSVLDAVAPLSTMLANA